MAKDNKTSTQRYNLYDGDAMTKRLSQYVPWFYSKYGELHGMDLMLTIGGTITTNYQNYMLCGYYSYSLVVNPYLKREKVTIDKTRNKMSRNINIKETLSTLNKFIKGDIDINNFKPYLDELFYTIVEYTDGRHDKNINEYGAISFKELIYFCCIEAFRDTLLKFADTYIDDSAIEVIIKNEQMIDQYVTMITQYAYDYVITVSGIILDDKRRKKDLENQSNEINKKYKKINDSYIEVYEKNENLIKQIQKLREENTRLDGKLRKIVNNDEELVRMRKENERLEKECEKLQKRYNDLRADYDLATASDENEDAPIAKDTKEILDYIKDKRIVFIRENNHKNMPLISRLKQYFNNIIFADSIDDIPADSIDIVIMHTRYIKHHTYYYVKDACKAKNVKYIHINQTNVNKIAEEIFANV